MRYARGSASGCTSGSYWYVQNNKKQKGKKEEERRREEKKKKREEERRIKKKKIKEVLMIPKQMLIHRTVSYLFMIRPRSSCSHIQMIAAQLEFNQGIQRREVRDRGEGGRE